MKKLPVYKGVVRLLESSSELRDYLKGIKADSIVSFDWETTGLSYDALPLGLSVHSDGHDSVFCPTDFFFSKGVPITEIANVCNEELHRFRMIAHNAKFDTMINLMNGIEDSSYKLYADTLVMMHLYDPSLNKNLEQRVKADFGYEKSTFKELTGLSWDKVNWSVKGDELLEILAGYAGEDTRWTTELFKKYSALMDSYAWKIHDRIELPMIPILRDAKIRGVLIDIPLLSEMEERANQLLEEALNSIYETTGCVFNLNSPKQKKEVFFDKMGLPVISQTKKGEPSTDAATYEAWAEMGYEIGERLQEFSTLNKLLSGYITAIPRMCDEHAVLRGDINSCGTETGRASSSNPNLQNQPNNKDLPIRQAFIPRPGYVFINYDYSQLELRVMAHLSKDPHFLEVFRSGGDPHSDVAERLGITRKGAKVVNFGVLYGMGGGKLAKTIDVDEATANKIIQVDYMTTYKGFAEWKHFTEEDASAKGYVRTLFGRMRRLPEALKPTNKGKYYAAMRQAVNTKVQGTGADIVKVSTIRAVERLKKAGLDCHFLLQVHDELLFECREDQMLLAEEIIIDAMSNTIKLEVPLDVDGKILKNWWEAKLDDVPSYSKRVFDPLILIL
jgi:DNA polymerase-1